MPRELRTVHWITALLVLLALVLDVVNGRFWLSDFRVYWGAADALIHGRAVYGVAFGEDTGFYKYAPIVAIAFIPAALLPFHVAAVIHVLFLGAALMLCQVALERLLMRHVFGNYAPRMVLRGCLGLLIIAVLLSRELHLGNINLWLVLGVVLATEALLDEAPGRAGLLLGVLWFVKPYLLLMAVPLVAFGRWQVLWYAVMMMLAGLFAPIVILGHAATHALTQDWFRSMLAHGSYLHSPDTLASLLRTWTDVAWTQRTGVLVAIAGLTLFLVCLVVRRRAGGDRPAALALLLWCSLALVPNLVITDQEHFLFTLPLITFLLSHLFRKRDPIALVLFLSGAFLYGTRSSDLWGNATETLWSGHGALGIGNLLIIGAVLTASKTRGWTASLAGR